jgi:RNA polymerase sigma-70 factor (ECF subfamily)
MAGAARVDAAARPVEPASPLELRALFEQHYAFVWRLLRRLGVLSAELDDAAQEVFWVTARRLSDIVPGREKPFLYGVALRVAAGEARRRRSVPVAGDAEELGNLVDPEPTPEDQVVQRQARILLDLALDRLPSELRTVFVLAELEGLQVADIALLEGLPLGTASSRLRRAREEFAAIAKRLRSQLAARGVRA